MRLHPLFAAPERVDSVVTGMLYTTLVCTSGMLLSPLLRRAMRFTRDAAWSSLQYRFPTVTQACSRHSEQFASTFRNRIITPLFESWLSGRSMATVLTIQNKTLDQLPRMFNVSVPMSEITRAASTSLNPGSLVIGLRVEGHRTGIAMTLQPSPPPFSQQSESGLYMPPSLPPEPREPLIITSS